MEKAYQLLEQNIVNPWIKKKKARPLVQLQINLTLKLLRNKEIVFRVLSLVSSLTSHPRFPTQPGVVVVVAVVVVDNCSWNTFQELKVSLGEFGLGRKFPRNKENRPKKALTTTRS